MQKNRQLTLGELAAVFRSARPDDRAKHHMTQWRKAVHMFSTYFQAKFSGDFNVDEWLQACGYTGSSVEDGELKEAKRLLGEARKAGLKHIANNIEAFINGGKPS